MRLHGYFKDNMLIQQGKPIVVNGYTNANESVIVCLRLSNKPVILLNSFDSFTRSTTADENGFFSIIFEALKASYDTWEIIVTGVAQEIVIKNILVGELWLTLGQSNMQYETQYIEEYNQIIKETSNNIRVLQLKENEEWKNIKRPGIPQNDFKNANWLTGDEQEGNEFAIKDISGLAMLFAIQLQKKINIPIGIVNAAIGGTTIDAWIDKAGIDSNSMVNNYLTRKNLYINDFSKYDEANDRSFDIMSGLFNEKIAPLKNIAFKGVIWYQGESNTGNYKDDARYYKAALGTLIESYRKWFQNKKLPFALVQITPYRYGTDNYAACYINEAISSILKCKNNIYIIPTYDVSNEWMGKEGTFWHPVHPTIKEPIASRICNCIYSNIYRKNDSYKAPNVTTILKRPDCLLVQYENTYEGLKGRNDNIEGFTISDEAGIYYKATAKIISANTIRLFNKYVQNPQEFTYAFSCYPQISTLYNCFDIPALPYRSKKEEIGDKPYYPNHYFAALSIDKVFECYGEPLFGGASKRNLWQAGTMFGSKEVEFNFNKISNISIEKEKKFKKIDLEENPYMDVFFKTYRECNFIFSISPSIDIVGMPHCFENYTKLTFEIENRSEKQIEFLGIDFITTENKAARFCNEGRAGTILIEANDEYKKITIDMTTANNGQSLNNMIDSKTRKNICKIQFTFLYEGSGRAKFRNMEFHNQRSIV